MSKTYIPAALRRLVEERARRLCEFCLLPADLAFMLPHEVDHVIAEKHGGDTVEGNLAFTCWRCNRHKGTDLTSFDPQTGELTLLFNPRSHRWAEHFALSGTALEGLTAIGRTTIRLLQLNAPERVAERQRLISLGRLALPSLE